MQVLKLDIDNADLELDLIRQILEDPALCSFISEMMFEMHYDHPDMAPAFGHPTTSWIETLRLFEDARRKGLRLHYWP